MKQKILWKRILFFVFISIVVLASLAGAAVYAFVSKIQTPASMIPMSQQASIDTVNTPADKAYQRINILLIGLDDGDPDTPDSPRRSDTMMVASIDAENKAVNLLSIPRDSRVIIPGHGYDKITHAYFYGGSDLAQRTVTDFLHIPIQYYIVIDWQSFIKVVDILGGVNLTVEHDMNYDDPYENLSIHLAKGNQHLNGEKSGEYVRYRHDELGDIGRVERQQHFLQALNSQLLQSGTILKLPALMTTISKYVHTNMNMYDWGKVANLLRDMKATSLHAEMVPGDFATINDISYWSPDTDKTKALVNSIFK